MLFGDTGYWIAIINPVDSLHEGALQASRSIDGAMIVTSEFVLGEVLDHFAAGSSNSRSIAVRFVGSLSRNAQVLVVPASTKLFENAVELYGSRLDKEWGLVDCSSFVIMKERGITEALAHDHHFVQAGFAALLREE